MADPDQFVTPTQTRTTYTLSEALDYDDIMNRLPTGSYKQYHWVDAQTGKRVSIGRGGGGNQKKLKGKSNYHN